MNIMFLGFSGNASVVPNLVSSELDQPKVHVISDEMSKEFKHYHNVMLTRNCSLGFFDDVENYEDIPLDEALLQEMSLCESHVLKMMDRYQHTKRLIFYEERINLYHKQLSYWINYLLKEKIESCIFQTIPHVIFDYIIYCLCKKLGIQTIMFHRIPVMLDSNVSLYVLEDIKNHISDLGQSYQEYQKNNHTKDLGQPMRSYLTLRKGNQGKTFSGIVSKNPISKKYLIPRTYQKYFQYKKNQIKSWISLWGNPMDLSLKFLYKKSMRKLNFFEVHKEVDLNCPFIFVSLHYQPECSTSPMGGSFVHQDLMIDILMKAAPNNIRIYIKSHPREGYSNTLIARVKKDSRTFFLKPEINSFPLISKSIAVATITGTAGWEGFICKKPVLMFGDYFYQDAPCVYKISSVLQCKLAFQSIQSGNALITDSMVTNFLMALEDNTFSGWVDNRYAQHSDLSEEENFKNLADKILSKINTKTFR